MSAVISPDGKYRYRLARDLGMMGNGTCCFIMLNPSTADATNDDQTIRKCIAYAKRFNTDRLEVVNLFAYRSRDPDALYGMSKNVAIGPENDQHISEVCGMARIVICAWGNHGVLFGRDKEVLRSLLFNRVNPKALKINNKSKQPAHPLYLKADAPLIDMVASLPER